MSVTTDLTPITPGFVRVIFPTTTADALNAQPYTVADISLASLALPEYANVVANANIHLIRSSAVAAYDASSTLTNAAELLALAQQVSRDFYRWNLAKLDQVFAGVCAWAPEGMSDSVEFVHNGLAGSADGICYTRVQRPEWNTAADLMHAGTPWQAGMRGSITNWLLYQDVNTQSVGNLQIRGELTSYSGSNFTFTHRARVYCTAMPSPDVTRTGNILTATANGAIGTIDGKTLALGDRVLYNPGTSDGGLYYLTALGDAGTPYTWTRTTDADTSGKVTAGMLVVVTEGTVNADTLWELATDDPITLNTTALTFIQIAPSTATSSILYRVRAYVAFSGSLPAYTRSGNVITANANGALPAQDGVTLAVGDRVLFNKFTSDTGIYSVTDLGSGGTPFILTRTTDSLVAGIAVMVTEGNKFMAVPGAPTLTTTATGGTLASSATYAYRVAAVALNSGITLASTETSITLAAGTATNTVTVTWPPVADANAYIVYGRTAGGELKMVTLNYGQTSWQDTGSVTPSGALPGSNTAAILSHADTLWELQTDDPITVNTTALTFTQIAPYIVPPAPPFAAYVFLQAALSPYSLSDGNATFLDGRGSIVGQAISMTSDGDVTLQEFSTSFRGGPITFINAGVHNITILHNYASGALSIRTFSGADVVLAHGECAQMLFTGGLSRCWCLSAVH